MEKKYVGLDLGSTYTKLVEIENSRVVGSRIAKSVKWESLIPAHTKNLCTTGYFRKKVKARCTITEITAAMLGVRHFFPDCEVIVDIGGQDIKVTDLRDNRFYINDKCSAGTGAFFEFILSYLDLNFNDLQANQKNAKIFHLNNTCTVFALSEIISYMTEGATPGDVIASINEAFAKKIAGILPECRTVVLIGGVARNQGFVESLRRCLKAALLIPPEPQMVNALGAALYIENKEGT